MAKLENFLGWENFKRTKFQAKWKRVCHTFSQVCEPANSHFLNGSNLPLQTMQVFGTTYAFGIARPLLTRSFPNCRFWRCVFVGTSTTKYDLGFGVHASQIEMPFFFCRRVSMFLRHLLTLMLDSNTADCVLQLTDFGWETVHLKQKRPSYSIRVVCWGNKGQLLSHCRISFPSQSLRRAKSSCRSRWTTRGTEPSACGFLPRWDIPFFVSKWTENEKVPEA